MGSERWIPSKRTLITVECAPVKALLITVARKRNSLASHKRVNNIDVIHFEVVKPSVNCGTSFIAACDCRVLRVSDSYLIVGIGRTVVGIAVDRQGALVAFHDDLLVVRAGVQENAGRGGRAACSE